MLNRSRRMSIIYTSVSCTLSYTWVYKHSVCIFVWVFIRLTVTWTILFIEKLWELPSFPPFLLFFLHLFSLHCILYLFYYWFLFFIFNLFSIFKWKNSFIFINMQTLIYMCLQIFFFSICMHIFLSINYCRTGQCLEC